MEPFAQEMACPVFLAGTECPGPGRANDQELGERRMEEIMRINGPLNRVKMMEFLRRWWSMRVEGKVVGSWVELAKEEASGWETFLVF